MQSTEKQDIYSRITGQIISLGPWQDHRHPIMHVLRKFVGTAPGLLDLLVGRSSLRPTLSLGH